MNLKETKLNSDTIKIKACIYGPSGTRKTTLMGSFPKPMKVFDFDHKFEVLYGQDIDIESYDCQNPAEWDRFWKDYLIAKRDPKWKTLGFDGLSTIDVLALKKAIALSGKSRDLAEIQDYRRLSDLYVTFFMDLMSQSLDKNVVVTAHEHYVIDNDSKLHKVTPLVTGQKILDKIPGIFKDTWKMESSVNEKGETTYVLRYRTYAKYVCSSSCMAGEGKIMFGTSIPTYERVMQEIMKGK